jgi:hypothetical protein
MEAAAAPYAEVNVSLVPASYRPVRIKPDSPGVR